MQKTYCDKCSKEILPCQQTYYALVPGLEIDKENMKTQYCGQDVRHVELCESCANSLLKVTCFENVKNAIHVERNTESKESRGKFGAVMWKENFTHDDVTIDIKKLLSAIGYCAPKNTITDFHFITD